MGGTFQLHRDAQSTLGVHLAFNFGSIVGVSFRGHHEAVAVYPHITGMEGEMNLCWRHRQKQVGPCAIRDGSREDPLPHCGSLMPPHSSAGGRRLTAALGSTVARVAEAGALLLPEPSMEALPAAPHCGHSTASAVGGSAAPAPRAACAAHVALAVPVHALHRPCACMPCTHPAHACPAAATHKPLKAARCPLTLAVPARVAPGTSALAAAHVEAPTVPAAHATGVPGHLWKHQSDSEGFRAGGSIPRVMQRPW